ncbi:hypothetical protein BO85DRAFT_438119 [Aspergillus piperis CBS 112811]|uniref:Uncharacterized protein n=1 Tax=Aspergillus piperis CBS 112811 TaxID=1448313 RepID=A0A8G1R2B1_9EURO|nr:hypothetical protein BO85DRAFT_438119 [Aspergillus piperis CBS 112811]RAH57887.1 hypothetical protein BO85DRAFT_438119 [Aspergillus piperis CBS 112811]
MSFYVVVDVDPDRDHDLLSSLIDVGFPWPPPYKRDRDDVHKSITFSLKSQKLGKFDCNRDYTYFEATEDTLMPRPPTKRNRLTSKAPPAAENDSQQGPGRHGITSKANTKSTEIANQIITDFPEMDQSGQASEIRRQLRNQTPLTRAQEHAIESSPIGDRETTGSRPATRARGYSSTLSVVGRKGDTGSKVPGTPAFESSILSNFRRRPRQPSIMQMMQAEDGSSDLDDDDDDVFLGSLSPEDESTPLNLSRSRPLPIRQTASPSPRHPTPSSDGSRKRKLSGETPHASQSDSEVTENSPVTSPTSQQRQSGIGVSVGHTQYPDSPGALSQTLAPPMSSSPPLSPTHTESPRGSAQQKHIDKPAEPATTNKLVLPTSALQDRLLPRRNRSQRKRFGMDGSEIREDLIDGDQPATEQDDDDDELYYLPSKQSSRAPRKRLVEQKSAKSTRTVQGAQPMADSVEGQILGGQHPAAQPNATAKKPGDKRMTYRTMGPNKENEPVDTSPLSSPLSSPPDSEESESESTAESTLGSHFLSDELRLQAKKFADVDKWELEFEDVAPDSQGSEVFR